MTTITTAVLLSNNTVVASSVSNSDCDSVHRWAQCYNLHQATGEIKMQLRTQLQTSK